MEPSLIANHGIHIIASTRAQFALSLFMDALSQTGTLLGNPAAIKKTVDSGGASVPIGIRNVYGRRQLIVPPQIKAFYVFDLSEDKSIVNFSGEERVPGLRGELPQRIEWLAIPEQPQRLRA
jgi:poly(3-hydroxyalkanoate) synthetase